MVDVSNLLHIGLEAFNIGVRTRIRDGVTAAFTAYVQNIEGVKASARAPHRDTLYKSLITVIKPITNIKLSVEYNAWTPAMCIWPGNLDELVKDYLPDSVTTAEHVKGDAFPKIDSAYHAAFNMDTGKVSGFAADIPVTILLNPDILIARGQTVPEMGATFCHEIGHFINYVTILTAGARYFSVVESLITGIRAADNSEQVVRLVKGASARYELVIDDPEYLRTIGDKEALRSVLLSSCNPIWANGIKNVISMSEMEIESDKFAIEIFGAATMATALAKCYQADSYKEYESSRAYYGKALVALAGVITGSMIGPIVGGVLAGLVIFGIINGASSIAYPRPLDRFVAMRSTLLAGTKIRDLPKVELERIRGEVEVIDQQISLLRNNGQSLGDIVASICSSDRRKQLKSRDMENKYRELANNLLWLRAAELQNAGK